MRDSGLRARRIRPRRRGGPPGRATTAGYGDLARIYDDEHRGVTNDIAFSLKALADEWVRGPVLDLGCGTGRISIPLAVAGYRITGVDLSGAMVRRARRL